MAYPLSEAQKAILFGSHVMTTTAWAMRGSELLGALPVISGTVTATLGTRGGRDAAFTTTKDAVKLIGLTPLTDTVVLSTGIKDVVEIVLFTGRVDTLDTTDAKIVGIQLLSSAAEAIRDDFIVPWPAEQFTVAAEIAAILQATNPSWPVDISRASMIPRTGQQVWETSRGQALDQLASGVSMIWMPTRFGGFEVFDNPYKIGPSLASESVAKFRDGQEGALVRIEDTVTRVGVYNAVTVVQERTDNSEPLRHTAFDNDPASPTFYSGAFGRQNKTIKNPASESPMALASRVLRQSLALRRSATIQAPHVPIFDPGDVFRPMHHIAPAS